MNDRNDSLEEIKFFMGIALGRLRAAGVSEEEVRREVDACLRSLTLLNGTREEAAFTTALTDVMGAMEKNRAGAALEVLKQKGFVK